MTFLPARKSVPRRGFALVLTLVVLVIASALLLGFIAVTKQNRIATSSYSRGMQAQEIALGALDQITGDLRSEIIANSTEQQVIPTGATAADGSPLGPIYKPGKDGASPEEMAKAVVPLRLGFDKTSANLANLIRRSAVPAVDSAAANPTDNSSTASADGRKISAERWNKPQFLPNTSDFVAPDWIVVTRDGPKMDATDGDVANFKNSAPTNQNFAVGRFAYAIYNEGGLLNVNVAGSPFDPTTATPEEKRKTGGKETAAWADLTQIGLAQDQIGLLGEWRNPNTWKDKIKYASETAIELSNPDKDKDTKGFTRVRTGDNAMLSRQELIDFVKAKGLPAQTVLPNLTTFSVALNSPSYLAPDSASAADKTRMQMGRYFYKGNPLRRFPLNTRLKLLETGADKDKADIAKYFGLTKGTGWANPGHRSWEYETTNLVDNGGKKYIATMEEALKAHREPNFFEVLKTAILEGSLGTQAGVGARNDMTWENAKIDNQVIRIGANIIDQYDADNYPTTIRFKEGGTIIRDFYGIEDLPYYSEMFAQFYCQQSPNGTNFLYKDNASIDLDVYHYFELWNPHQTPPATASAGDGPTEVRIRANTGKFQAGIVFNYGSNDPTMKDKDGKPLPVPSRLAPWGDTKATPASWPTDPIVVDITKTDYRTPHIVQDGANPETIGGEKVNAYKLTYHWSLPSDEQMNNRAWPVQAACKWMNLVLTLEYSANGAWYPYTTLSGLPNGKGTGGLFYSADDKPGVIIETTKSEIVPYCNVSPLDGLHPFCAWFKSDPRTDRLGVNFFNGGAEDRMNQPTICGKAPYSSGGFQANGGQSTYVDKTKPGALVTNTGAAQAKDNDDVIRPGDAGVTSPYQSQADPMTTSSARPVMLNRPFRSVGELGHAFRDQPWKTLNFSSKESADAALLDMFCLEDTDADAAPAAGTAMDTRNNLIAGQVDLNTQNKEVLAALLSGTISKYTLGTSLDANAATTIADSVIKFTAKTPIYSPSELVTGFMKSIEGETSTPFSPVKQEREAIIRALASTGQTRTWNLLVDVIAQSGRYPNSALTTSLANFQVEGERRYWLHLAIDRLTGKVIAKELELVVE